MKRLINAVGPETVSEAGATDIEAGRVFGDTIDMLRRVECVAKNGLV